MSENQTGVTVTLKAGTGFEAPWIVVHASDVTDALKQIDTGDFGTLAERAVAAAEFFRAAHNVKTGLAPTPAPAAPPQQQGGWNTGAQTPPPAFAQPAAPAPAGGESCIHGPMKYTTSKPGAAKAWQAWFCPTPKGTPGQCEPVWIR